MHYYNTATHHPAKMDNPLHRNCMVGLYKTHCQCTTAPLRQSGNAVSLKLNNWQHTPWHRLSHSIIITHVQHLTDIQLGSTVTLQNPRTNLWDIYGTVVNISPYRRYSKWTYSSTRQKIFKTSYSCSLVCICGKPSAVRHQSTSSRDTTNSSRYSRATPASHRTSDPQLRRSDRPCRLPQRLIADPTWP